MISYNALKDNLLVPLTQSQLLEEIENLHQIFVHDRQKLTEYGQNVHSVAAYTLFHLYSNQLKWTYLTQTLSPKLIDSIKHIDWIDMGCGPGTFGLSILSHWPEFNKHLYFIDHCELMLSQGKKLLKNLFPSFQNAYFGSKLPLKTQRKTGIIFGHSFNEMASQEVLEIIYKIEPEYIVFIEPGTMDVFQKFLPLRQKLLSTGYFCHFPCPHSQSIHCPLGQENWCHQTLHVQYEVEYERLCQILKKDRRTLPVLIHFFEKGTSTSLTTFARFLRLLKETKFSFIFEVCCFENEVRKCELLKKELSKSRIKQIKRDHTTGFEMSIIWERKLQDNFWRGRWIEE